MKSDPGSSKENTV